MVRNLLLSVSVYIIRNFMNIRSIIAALMVLCLGAAPGFARKKTKSNPQAKPPLIVEMPSDEMALHALNRLAFGPRPGDVEQVRAMGVQAWIRQQLHPESIAENPVLDTKLATLDTLQMGSFEMLQKYPSNLMIKLMIANKVDWPEDPQMRVVAQRIADRYRDQFEGNKNADKTVKFTLDDALAELRPDQAAIFQTGTPVQQLAAIDSMPVGLQYDVVTTMTGPQRQKIVAISSPADRRRLETFAGTQRLVNKDLADAKLYRAVYSNRQLQEVLADFWFNHFNVYQDKGADRYLITAYERDAIRPFVLGKFEDLLIAAAQSPAMLFYLDNFQSVKPDADAKNPKQVKRGLNENYGRELMELHTLGVDGGYTQHDVTEVARCFTGWTIREPRRGGSFEFNPKQHDNGEKVVLGVTIPAGGGIDDGYKVLDILAHQPATARFISRSLAIRFVSDNPPPALVDRMAATFAKTDGDLREVMNTMVQSPEFWAQDAYRAKIKSPFEMVVSALRATNADVEFTNAVENALNQLGEPLYRKQEPTGYSNKSSEWMNSAALLGRMNFALNLTINKVNGVKVILPAATDPDSMAQGLLGAPLTADSRQIVTARLNELAQTPVATTTNVAQTNRPQQPAVNTAGLIAGLTLGSPDFQRR